MPSGRPPVPLNRRFWAKVSVVDDEDSCWNWLFNKDRAGYGKIWVNETMRAASAHRVSWFLSTGKWPKKCVCHHCDNPSCVRPSHLWLGTNLENSHDRVNKGRSAVNINPQIGEKNGRAKLKRGQVDEIRRLYLAGEEQIHLAKVFGVTQGLISAIVLGKLWRAYQNGKEVEV